MLVSNHNIRRRNSAEYDELRLHHCENLRIRIMISVI